MAAAIVTRIFITSNSPSFFLLKRILPPSLLHLHPSSPSPFLSYAPSLSFSATNLFKARPFSTSDDPAASAAPKRNTLVNFSLSDSDSEEEESEKTLTKQIDKSKLPPPYDPFNKKPAIEEPEDPTNLQEVFQKIRSDGLTNNAVKMFDGLSKDGLTHEALELFSQIKDKGQMPDVVAHTAVIEAYANAGQPKEAHKVYLRMLASGVLPNAYTYSILIRALAKSGDEKLVMEGKKYVVEMVEKRRIRPNAGTCCGVFEGLVEMGKEEEGKELLEMLRRKGVVPEESKVREVLKNKRGPVYRTVMSVLYGK